MAVNPTAIPVPLPVDDLAVLRHRRSAKWHRFAADVLPLTVAEMDFALAPPIRDALPEAVGGPTRGTRCRGRTSGSVAGFAADAVGLGHRPRSGDGGNRCRVGVVELLRGC